MGAEKERFTDNFGSVVIFRNSKASFRFETIRMPRSRNHCSVGEGSNCKENSHPVFGSNNAIEQGIYQGSRIFHSTFFISGCSISRQYICVSGLYFPETRTIGVLG